MKKVQKWLKSPLGISLVTATFTFILTLVYDLIKVRPILSTLQNIFSIVLNAITAFMNYELRVWWVLVGLVATTTFLYVILKIYFETKESNEDIASLLNYTEDNIQGWCWTWQWGKGYSGKYSLVNLHPVCHNCKTPYVKEETYLSSVIKCPRCNYSPDMSLPDYHQIEVIILDNVTRGLLPDVIKEK